MNNIQNNKILVYFLVVFFAVFVGTSIFLLINNEKSIKQESPTPTSTTKQEEMVFPTVVTKRGEMKLVLEKNEEQILLNLQADSDKESITAFDVLVGYDSSSVDFVNAVSLDPAFQVYSFTKFNYLTMTVVKTSQDSSQSVFDGKPIIRLTFKPKKSGDFSFRVLSSLDKETSKFVNEKNEVIYPKISEVSVNVK